MGLIRIELDGCFRKIEGPRTHVCRAIDHGHADAVAQAIEWLSAHVLPQAIALDHELHDGGHYPNEGFRRKGGP